MVDKQPSVPSSFFLNRVLRSLSNHKFQLGQRVCWIPQPSTDWGTIIGLEYEWSGTLESWQPKYCVLLDADSPSREWVDRDWAWEKDIQPIAAVAAKAES